MDGNRIPAGGPVRPAPVRREPRRIVQIAGDNESLMALCNDGTVWEYCPSMRDWLPLPGIPQRQLPEGDL